MARSFLENAVAKNPSYGPLWQALGQACGQLGDYPASLAALEKAVAHMPHDASTHRFLAFTLAKLGQVDRSLRHAVETIRCGKGDVKWFVEIGIFLSQGGHRNAILAAFPKARVHAQTAEQRAKLDRAERTFENLRGH